MFHINACSLSKNFADLEYLFKSANISMILLEYQKQE